MTLETAEFVRTLNPDFSWMDRENKTAVKKIYRAEIDQAKAGITELNQEKLAANRKYTAWKDYWALEMLQESIDQAIARRRKEIRRDEYILKFGQRSIGAVTDADIEAAKAVPIETFYEGKLRRVAGRLLGLCPFHKNGQERTPSFVIYPNNTYHCFACQANGDSIDFVQRRQGTGFLDAVKFLTNK